jgi:hypothetical protein
MSFNSRLITVIFCSTFSLLSAAFGQKASIEGDVKGVDGRPAKSSEIRIERQDKKAAPVIVKTNLRGHLAATNLEVGTYKLTATVAGGIQSTQVIKTSVQKPLLVTFDFEKHPAVTNKSKKRLVYVPAPTGTRIGGGWVEVNDDGQPTTNPTGQKVDTMSGSSLDRFNTHVSNPSSTGGR